MPQSKNKRVIRTFSADFKNQIVLMYLNGKRKCDILREYDLGAPSLNNWIKKTETDGPFIDKDNIETVFKEKVNVVIEDKQGKFDLHKRIKELEEENNILKQALMILGRK